MPVDRLLPSDDAVDQIALTRDICDKVLDPIGFGLENYDAIGRWRTVDDSAGKIDASGSADRFHAEGALSIGPPVAA